MKFSKKQLQRSMVHLNRVVERESGAYAGLVLVASAFAGLLDVYAQPNPENPQGMCDNPVTFRKHFADMIASLPILKEKVRLS